MSLEESVDKCLESLQTLQEYAKKREWVQRITSTRDLLDKFERSIGGSLLLLQTWITQFDSGKQINNDEIIIPVEQVLETLKQCIDAARNAPKARMSHRRIYLGGSVRKERLALVLVPATPRANPSLGRGSKLA